MIINDVQKKIEDCNERIASYNLQIESILSKEPYSLDKLTTVIKEIDSTIDELQQLITSIE